MTELDVGGLKQGVGPASCSLLCSRDSTWWSHFYEHMPGKL